MSEVRSFRLAPEPQGSRTAWLLLPLSALLVVVIAVFFVFHVPGVVDGSSMEPAMADGDRFLETRTYRAPRRGDIVSFLAFDERVGATVPLLKRVVAVPGDTVYVEGDRAWVNGAPEPDRPLIAVDTSPSVGPLKVEGGQVFVLGDNRTESLDSRHIGAIPLASVNGRVVAVFWPLTSLRLTATSTEVDAVRSANASPPTRSISNGRG